MIKEAKIMAVLVLLALCGFVCTVEGNGPISHWMFDEGSGTTAYDSVGDNNGTVYGAVWTTGQIDGALDFDGDGDYVDFGDIDEFEFGNNDFAVSFWFYAKGPHSHEGNVGTIVGKYSYVLGRQWIFSHWLESGTIYFETFPTGAQMEEPLPSSTAVYECQWVHVVGVRNGSTKLLYINGVLDNTQATQGVITGKSTKVYIGCRENVYKGYFFNGVIDDVRIYNRALSAEEVEELYRGQLIGLEIVGPDEMAEDFQAQYKAIARYDNNSTADVTDLAEWLVEPEATAGIEAGLLETEGIDRPEENITIYAQYTEGEITVSAQKAVSVLAICPSGSALDFDGVDDYILISNVIGGFSEADFTLSLWVKPNDIIADQYITSGAISGIAENKRCIILGSQDSYFNIFNNGVYPTGSATDTQIVATQNGWQHLVYASDGSRIYGYKNGELTINVSGNLNVAGGDIDTYCIGSTTRPSTFFNGVIDDVRIYDRALSAKEIRELMHKRPVSDEPNLIGYWDFDEGKGQVAGDSSGNGNDGQLGSTPEADDSDPEWIESDAPVGICTIRGFVERNITDVLEIKLNILEELEAALAKENATIDMLEELFRGREYGDLNKGEILAVKKNVHLAIQDEERLRKPMEKSVGKLQDSLSVLGCEPVQE